MGLGMQEVGGQAGQRVLGPEAEAWGWEGGSGRRASRSRLPCPLHREAAWLGLAGLGEGAFRPKVRAGRRWLSGVRASAASGGVPEPPASAVGAGP